MKPSLVRRHLETKHANLKNKPQEFFQRELRLLSSSKTCIKATDAINKKALESSYMVSYRVARTGKHHTIVEDLSLPASADMAWGKNPKKLYSFHDASVTWQMFGTITASPYKPIIICVTAR